MVTLSLLPDFSSDILADVAAVVGEERVGPVVVLDIIVVPWAGLGEGRS